MAATAVAKISKNKWSSAWAKFSKKAGVRFMRAIVNEFTTCLSLSLSPWP
jgi:hypothetical protein